MLPVNIALIKGFSVHGVRAGEYGRQNPAKGRENHDQCQCEAFTRLDAGPSIHLSHG